MTYRTRISSLLVLMLAGVALTGCLNLSSMQTAKTLEPGEFSGTVGGGLYSLSDFSSDPDEVSVDDVAPLSFPALELMGRIGIVENLDAGVKFTLIGTAAADVKYKLLDTGTFALSVGASLGVLPLGVTLVDLILPVYMSVHPSEWFSFYVVPKVLGRGYFLDGLLDARPSVGGTAGIKLGNDIGFMLEASYARNVAVDFPLDFLQVNGGFFFSFGGSEN